MSQESKPHLSSQQKFQSDQTGLIQKSTKYDHFKDHLEFINWENSVKSKQLKKAGKRYRRLEFSQRLVKPRHREKLRELFIVYEGLEIPINNSRVGHNLFMLREIRLQLLRVIDQQVIEHHLVSKLEQQDWKEIKTIEEGKRFLSELKRY